MRTSTVFAATTLCLATIVSACLDGVSDPAEAEQGAGGNKLGGIFHRDVQDKYVGVVLVQTGDDDYQQICTGTIISDRHVLTAAHCAMNDMDVTIKVVGNGHMVLLRGTIEPHPEYDANARTPNDIAIVTLAPDYQTDKIKAFFASNKIGLADATSIPKSNWTTVGFDIPNAWGNTPPERRYGDMETEWCLLHLNETFCFEDDDGGVIFGAGDSGAPILMNPQSGGPQVVGAVAIRISSVAFSLWRTVHAIDILPYRAWIDAQLAR
ncbi:MAG: trypsin-like serine protease [Myxococcales bacterium]|nr:trypsin-like serine protease [Myxococcales bacterium]